MERSRTIMMGEQQAYKALARSVRGAPNITLAFHIGKVCKAKDKNCYD